MKKALKFLLLLALMGPVVTTTAVSCNNSSLVDYAAKMKFDENSGRAHCEATIKQCVDGDTTHFYVDNSVVAGGILKARYLGIDTPESTGKIEEYGKQASNFTKEKLTSDPETKIILESNTSTWDADSTGERYLVFVWYKTSTMKDYKCLNVEIMQNGLAKAKNGNATVYGKELAAALNQAMNKKLKVYSGERDPLYYYGEYQEVTIKGLRETPEDYKGVLVRFNGIIAKIDSNTAYVYDVDAETGLTYGMTVYYGFDASVTSQMETGRLISWCGTYQYYEAGQTYQVSGLTYMAMKPNYAKNLKVLEENVEIVPVVMTGSQFNMTQASDLYNGISYMDAMLSAYVKMENLVVTDVYTTKKGDSTGAMTLTCTSPDGKQVSVRTSVLKKADGTLLAKDDVMGKTIDVTGVVGKYAMEGETPSFQIMVFTLPDIIIK